MAEIRMSSRYYLKILRISLYIGSVMLFISVSCQIWSQSRDNLENINPLVHLEYNRYRKIWVWADSVISEKELYPEAAEVDDVLDALRQAPIVEVHTLDASKYENGVTWVGKWVVTLEGDQKALIKLDWGNRDSDKPGKKCAESFEKPTSEIAAFTLDRILGFRKIPYVTGRKINLKDILPVASWDVAKQIKILPGTEACIFSKKHRRLCPPNGTVEASVSYWLPRDVEMITKMNHWKPFSRHNIQMWHKINFNNRTYCDAVKKNGFYSDLDYFHDLMDLSLIDFLMYHYDRKHYVMYQDNQSKGTTVWIDHGRALRRSTWEKIKSLKSGELSRKWRQSMTSDPIAPVMQDDWFPAVERRLATIIRVVEKCIDANKHKEEVLV